MLPRRSLAEVADGRVEGVQGRVLVALEPDDGKPPVFTPKKDVPNHAFQDFLWLFGPHDWVET